jgi:hypothetical protein
VTVLLPNVSVVVMSANGKDTHGWVLPSPTVVWSGEASFQPNSYPSSATASDRGGRGPFDPSGAPEATLYVGMDAVIAPGMTVTIMGDTRWAVDTVQVSTAPAGADFLNCRVATLTMLGEA